MNLDVKSTWRPAYPVYARMDCSACHGTGWQMMPGPGAGFARRCNCRLTVSTEQMAGRLRIPPRHSDCTLGNFSPQNFSQVRALAEARRFAERFPDVERGLFFAGASGVGKTHLAVGIAAELMHRFQDDVLFVDFPALMNSRPGAGLAGGFDWGRLRSVSLLLLDNFGCLVPSFDSVCITEELLRFRIEAKKPTIFTGERLRSREIFNVPARGTLSRTHAFLMALPRGSTVRLLSCNRIVTLVGEDFRKRSRLG
jgi:DNA replication protein DnaC